MSIYRTIRPSGLWRASETCTRCLQTQLRIQRRNPFQTQRQSLHSVPNLTNAPIFEETGVSGLLSAEGYNIAWTQYQQMILDRLNSITAGAEEHNMFPKDIVLKHARNPLTASIFNYASMAFNNKFFFETLTVTPKVVEDYRSLHESLIKTFGSIETLKKEMIETAAAMFGPGFVWLVWSRSGADRGMRSADANDGWRILATYNAGTPFPEAGFRRQGRDMNNVGTFGQYSQAGKVAASRGPGTAFVDPILCVNTWEHVWLRDWTILGKRDYLHRWWDTIDWQVVSGKAPQAALNKQDRFMIS